MAKKEENNKEQVRNRYADEELQEFKALILRKLEKARHDLELLTDAFTGKNENDTSDTSPTFKVLEEGCSVMSKEENSHLAARQQKFIKSLEAALVRIENKTYGICRGTGNLISKERLRAVPHATLSIEAKLNQKPVSKFPTLPENMIADEPTDE
jgi:DnaK suppressor protein